MRAAGRDLSVGVGGVQVRGQCQYAGVNASGGRVQGDLLTRPPLDNLQLAAPYSESYDVVKSGQNVFGNLFNHLHDGAFAETQMQPNMLHTRLTQCF
ncbi:hypothetical protein PS858_01457 [Pseudomonas fluorescens]|jgi:hypothetical protein|nr:hypothetical protein PS858_01457 [Pseudomonas fluorescens]